MGTPRDDVAYFRYAPNAKTFLCADEESPLGAHHDGHIGDTQLCRRPGRSPELDLAVHSLERECQRKCAVLANDKQSISEVGTRRSRPRITFPVSGVLASGLSVARGSSQSPTQSAMPFPLDHSGEEL